MGQDLTAAPLKRLNVGIVGAGFAATSVHLPFLKALPAANVVAVADTAPGRAASVAGRFGIPSYAEDYRTLLRRDDIQVIDICTPPQFHAQIACESLERGKHVISEKPLAMNLVEYEAIRDALLRNASSHIGVVLNLRYMPLVHSMVEILHSGTLGGLRSISAVIHTTPPPAGLLVDHALVEYGVIFDYLPHVLDLVMWALQAHPVEVRCLASSPQGRGFYLLVNMRSPIAGECSLLVDVAWTSATSLRQVQFWGADRDLLVDLQDQFLSLTRGHLTPPKRAREFMQRLGGLAKRAAGGRMAIKYGAMVHHRELLGDFISAFSAGRCPRPSLSDSLLHVATLDAAVRSHMEGRMVTIPEEAVAA